MKPLEFIIFGNYLSIFFFLFLLVFCITSKNFPVKLNRYIIITLVLTTFLGILDCINSYYRRAPELHYTRILASTTAYMVRPVCAALYLMMSIKNNKKSHMFILAVVVVNTIIVSLNYKFPVVYYIDEQNVFHRAKFWYVPYLSSFGFVAALFVSACTQIRLNRRKSIFTFAVIISVTLGALGEAFDLIRFALPAAGIVSLFFYYLYMNTDLYKRDTLTKLYKRESFDIDLHKFSRKKMVIASLDLNDLKLWNDRYGHSAGDKAITTSVEGMNKFFEKIGVIYRTGGDEFIILIPKKCMAELTEEIQGFKDFMNNTPYRVAFGCADYKRGDNLEEVLKLSDQRMYEDKKLLKTQPGYKV